MELDHDMTNNKEQASKDRETNGSGNGNSNSEILRRLTELQKTAETIRTSHHLDNDDDEEEEEEEDTDMDGSHLDHTNSEGDLSYDGLQEDETNLSFDESSVNQEEDIISHGVNPSHEETAGVRTRTIQSPSVESILLKNGVLPCSLQMFYAMAVAKKEENKTKTERMNSKPPQDSCPSMNDNEDDHDIQLLRESSEIERAIDISNLKVSTTKELNHDLLDIGHDDDDAYQIEKQTTTGSQDINISPPPSAKSFKRFFSGLGGILASKSSEENQRDSSKYQTYLPVSPSSGDQLLQVSPPTPRVTLPVTVVESVPIEHEFLKWDASDTESEDAWLLYTIFRKFCYPPPSFESVRDILKNERVRLERKEQQRHHQMGHKNVPLSKDVAINVGDSTVEKLPNPFSGPTNSSETASSAARILDGVLLDLPLSFQLAYLRILIRLLTNENDDAYDSECFMDYSFGAISNLGSDSNKESNSDGDDVCDENIQGTSPNTDGRTKVSDTSENDFIKTESFRDDTKNNIFRTRNNDRIGAHIVRSDTSRLTDLHEIKNNQLYSVVRFRCGEKEKSSIDSVLTFIERVLENSLSAENSPSLQIFILGPLCRLLGLLCMTGITVRQLQQIINMIKTCSQPGMEEVEVKSSKDKALPPISIFTALRLSLLRAVIVSAEGASPVKKLLGKASPRSFFCFGVSDGMVHRFSKSNGASNVPPFKTSFGMACWFRAESFEEIECTTGDVNRSNKPALLSVRTGDSAGIEVSFKVLPTEKSECAANIVVTVFDSEGSTKTSHTSLCSTVELSSCPIFPKVWYHLAIRHVKKGYLSLAKDELTIFLDGKALLNEPLKFPNLSTSHENVSSRSLNDINRFRERKEELAIKFWSGLDGATGALYLFNDSITDATVRALLEVTSGVAPENNEQSRASGFTSMIDKTLGSQRQNSFQEGVNTNMALKTADAKEIIIGTSQESTQGNHSRALSGVVDLVGDDELIGESGLSQAAFSSKLFLVWDPLRICDESVVLEAHNNANIKVDRTNTVPWIISGSKDVIGSMGGIRSLLPLFRILLNIDMENSSCQECFESSLFLPIIFLLLAAFLRDNEVNCREWLRCGGFEVLEHFISSHKNRCIKNEMSATRGIDDTRQMSCAFRQSSYTAEQMVDSLFELQDACSFYTSMEINMSCRLVYNFNMWFGGLCSSPGIFLFKLLLPLFASLCKKDPKKMLLYIEIGDFIRLLRECTTIDSETPDESESCFKTTKYSFDPLTISERRHVTDIVFGMIALILREETKKNDLAPLIQFISFNMEIEWTANSREVKEHSGEGQIESTRKERLLASEKAGSVLLYLLQYRPTIPGFFQSFQQCVGDPSSWILCCFVNSFDDDIRSIGIRCLTAYLDYAVSSIDQEVDAVSKNQTFLVNPQIRSAKKAASKISNTMKYVGVGMGVIPKALVPSSITVTIIYKLLWHVLKCHRFSLGSQTHTALINLLIESTNDQFAPKATATSQHIFPVDSVVGIGYRFNHKWVGISETNERIETSQKIRNTAAASIILRLLQFLPNEEKERWLFDLLALIRISRSSVSEIVATKDWQHCLFHVVSDIVEEVSNYNTTKMELQRSIDHCSIVLGESTDHSLKSDKDNGVLARFDLSFKLYATLLAQCIRDGERSFFALEQAAALKRVFVNGEAVFNILLSHVFADLIENGVLSSTYFSTLENDRVLEPEQSLKESARLINEAILSSGASGIDMTVAAAQWRNIIHLSTIAVAVILSNGFGMSELFDYRNNNASAIDLTTGGFYGIRIIDQNSSAITSAHVMTEAAPLQGTEEDRNRDDGYEHRRRSCVIMASQLLDLLDPFLFPDHLPSKAAARLHGLTMVQSIETRLGKRQGPLVASLLRISLILLSHLEPSSSKFLQCCSMLRCFLHWSLDLIRKLAGSVNGYCSPFHELTAPFDRLVVCLVIQCHRALSRCSSVLIEIESTSHEMYFSKLERQKHIKRLIRAIGSLRDTVIGAFKGRNDVLRASLSLQAYEALEDALDEKSEFMLGELNRQSLKITGDNGSIAKEASIRAFLRTSWVMGFQDVDLKDELAIPEQLANGQIYRNRTASNRGFLVMKELFIESKAISDEYDQALDAPFQAYLEEHRQWANTTAVRDLEYEGNFAISRLAGEHKNNTAERKKSDDLRAKISMQLWSEIEKNLKPDSQWKHWKLAKYTDRLHRRILLVPNKSFDSHQSASYDLVLGIERERALKEREMRIRTRKENELSSIVLLAKEGIIHPTSFDADEDKVDLFTSGLKTSSIESDSDEVSIEPLTEEGALEPGALITDWDHVNSENIFINESNDLSAQRGTHLWAKSFIWQHGEKVVQMFESVHLVSLQFVVEGELLLTSHSIYFRPLSEKISVMTKEKLATDTSEKNASETSAVEEYRWRLNRLIAVHGRRYLLRAQAIELFFADTHEVFLNFNQGTKERNKFYNKLRSCKCPMLFAPKTLNPKSVFKNNKLTLLWQKRKISNFEYLMQLNLMAGRSFNDITQYPVFPWVLADYENEVLDLNDPKTFRDLSRPVGALNEDRLLQLIERYHDLDGLPEEEKFLYGSHYSSPGVVLHYLIRQEPFTKMAIELQSGRFDCADRLFHDLAGCWRSCLGSSSDVKELLPELFTCPEFFSNTNNFPLGHTQNHVSINDVKLPPWAKGSPYEFIRMHKLALESDYVSNHLSDWIDLIFGFKQRGPEAVKANNIFHYLSYEGAVDLDKITDEVDRKATESQIQNFGQTPCQLLTTPHPKRHSSDQCWKPLISDLSPTSPLTSYTPKKQFGGGHNAVVQGAVLSIHCLMDQVLVVYANLNVGIYRWSTQGGKIPFSFKMDKVRPLPCRELSVCPFAVKWNKVSSKNAVPRKMEELSPGGMLGIGNWSFSMVSGGSGAESTTNHPLGSDLKAKEVKSSSLDSSSLLMSCGYFDSTVKAFMNDNFRLKCSKSGGHRGPINCICSDETSTLMITGGVDTTVRVWTVEDTNLGAALMDGYIQTALGKSSIESNDSTLLCCHVLWGHVTAITCLAFSSDLDVVISGSLDGVVCVHTVRQGKYIRSLHVDDFYNLQKKKVQTCVRKLALDNDGTFVAHLDNGLLQLYTVNGVKLGCVDAGEKINAMEIIPGGRTLVTGGESCHVTLRRLEQNLEITHTLDLSRYGPIHCISFTSPRFKSGQQFMLVGTEDGRVTVVCNQKIDEANKKEAKDHEYDTHLSSKVRNDHSWWKTQESYED